MENKYRKVWKIVFQKSLSEKQTHPKQILKVDEILH
jgi:hypothetical protein